METLTAWMSVNLTILFLSLFAQILLSDSSPLNKEARSENSPCSKGWIHYQRFCVTPAKGESEPAVALYCNGFGGIGIKGYCITKAHNIDEDDFEETKHQSSNSLDDALLRAAARKQESNSLGDLMNPSSEEANSRLDVEEIACPKGWKHYGKLCVYQPLSIKDQCHVLNAVEFSGLCLKHADIQALERRGLKYSTPNAGPEKRVCCCAHVHAKDNGYGCI